MRHRNFILLVQVYTCFSKMFMKMTKSVKWPVIIMIMGVLLIAAGTAKYFKVID